MEAVVLTFCGDTKPADKYNDSDVGDFFLKKEGKQMILFLTSLYRYSYKSCQPFELLSALLSTSESSLQNPVDHMSENQDKSRALNLSESISDQTQVQSLSFVTRINIVHPTCQELTVVNNLLPFVSRPRVVDISRRRKTESYNSQVIDRMASRISFTNNLQHLSLSFNLTAKSAGDIAGSLHQAPNLQTLDLSENNFHSSVGDLAEKLHHAMQLSSLSLHDVHMGDQECRLLATSLVHVTRLERLDLSCNPLGRGIAELAQHLASVPHLVMLNLMDTQMGEEEVTALARNLKPISKIERLLLSNNPLGHGITELGQNLNSVPHLRELALRKTQMGEEEVRAITRALKYLPELSSLDLSHNPLGRGIGELTQYLSSTGQLSPKLFGVKMTKKEASEMCTAVSGSKMVLNTDYHELVSETFILSFNILFCNTFFLINISLFISSSCLQGETILLQIT